MRRIAFALAVLGVLSAGRPMAVAEEGTGGGLVSKVGVVRGICVVLGDKECATALDLVRGSELTAYVQLTGSGDVEAACRAADRAGLYGTRIFVAKGPLTRIGLADNIADGLVAFAGRGSRMSHWPTGASATGGASYGGSWSRMPSAWSERNWNCPVDRAGTGKGDITGFRLWLGAGGAVVGGAPLASPADGRRRLCQAASLSLGPGG